MASTCHSVRWSLTRTARAPSHSPGTVGVSEADSNRVLEPSTEETGSPRDRGDPRSYGGRVLCGGVVRNKLPAAPEKTGSPRKIPPDHQLSDNLPAQVAGNPNQDAQVALLLR